MDEWTRNPIERRPDFEASIRAQMTAMERAFPESCVTGGESLIPALTLPDPDDRHVLATAIRTSAEHIITENLKDFPDEALATFGITAVTPDEFLSSTFELYSGDALSTLRNTRQDYRNPPFTPGEFIFELQRQGLPKLASMLKEHIDLP